MADFDRHFNRIPKLTRIYPMTIQTKI